jgi:hypothetical protein
MSLVSEIWTWSENGRLYSSATANVSSARFVAKLAWLELLELAETIHAFFDDRVYGGNGHEILWKECVQMNDLKNLVHL